MGKPIVSYISLKHIYQHQPPQFILDMLARIEKRGRTQIRTIKPGIDVVVHGVTQGELDMINRMKNGTLGPRYYIPTNESIEEIRKLSESRINLPKKKYPDKISGDYPNGVWDRFEYDNSGRPIYYDNENGHWVKYEYDNNGNKIYSETYNGYWNKWEYDQNGKVTYSEDSLGYIIDNRPNINESRINLRKKEYPDKIEGNYPNGKWSRTVFDNIGNIIYWENSDGEWKRWEYDENGNVIYSEQNDENGNNIYWEDYSGMVIDNRPQVNESRINLPVKKDETITLRKVGDHVEYFDETGNRITGTIESINNDEAYVNGDWRSLKVLHFLYRPNHISESRINLRPIERDEFDTWLHNYISDTTRYTNPEYPDDIYWMKPFSTKSSRIVFNLTKYYDNDTALCYDSEIRSKFFDVDYGQIFTVDELNRRIHKVFNDFYPIPDSVFYIDEHKFMDMTDVEYGFITRSYIESQGDNLQESQRINLRIKSPENYLRGIIEKCVELPPDDLGCRYWGNAQEKKIYFSYEGGSYLNYRLEIFNVLTDEYRMDHKDRRKLIHELVCPAFGIEYPVNNILSFSAEYSESIESLEQNYDWNKVINEGRINLKVKDPDAEDYIEKLVNGLSIKEFNMGNISPRLILYDNETQRAVGLYRQESGHVVVNYDVFFKDAFPLLRFEQTTNDIRDYIQYFLQTKFNIDISEVHHNHDQDENILVDSFWDALTQECHKRMNEGHRINLRKKEYPDKITGDYPDGNWTIRKYNDQGNVIYKEYSDGGTRQFDNSGNLIYARYANGDWVKKEYDENGKVIYYENSKGYWAKREYDDNGHLVYLENSDGIVDDDRDQINESRINLRVSTKPIEHIYTIIAATHNGIKYTNPAGIIDLIEQQPSTTKVDYIDDNGNQHTSDVKKLEYYNFKCGDEYYFYVPDENVAAKCTVYEITGIIDNNKPQQIITKPDMIGRMMNRGLEEGDITAIIKDVSGEVKKIDPAAPEYQDQPFYLWRLPDGYYYTYLDGNLDITEYEFK